YVGDELSFKVTAPLATECLLEARLLGCELCLRPASSIASNVLDFLLTVDLVSSSMLFLILCSRLVRFLDFGCFFSSISSSSESVDLCFFLLDFFEMLLFVLDVLVIFTNCESSSLTKVC